MAADAGGHGGADRVPIIRRAALEHAEFCGGGLCICGGDIEHLFAARRQNGGDLRGQRHRNGHARTGGECDEQDKQTMHEEIKTPQRFETLRRE